MYLCVVKRAAANISNLICLWLLWFSKTAIITSITRFEKCNNIVLLCLKALRKWYLISLSITGQVTIPCVLFVFFSYIIVFLKSSYAGNNCCFWESQLSQAYYIWEICRCPFCNTQSGSIIETITPLSWLDGNICQAVGNASKQADLPLPVLQHKYIVSIV